jgi:hypothetical protein
MLLYIMQQIKLNNLICKFIKFIFLVIKVNLKTAMKISDRLQMIEYIDYGSARVTGLHAVIGCQY